MENRPVALITGCSTGIGFETALLLSRSGYRVFAGIRNLNKAGALSQAALGLALEIIPLDVDKPDSVRKASATLLKKTGRLDVLVNNAGWGAFGALEEFTDEEILAQYETNVIGVMRVTRAFLPVMRAQKSGRIINVGSLAGKMTFAGISLYCSSKYAVESLTESLRMELRPFNIETTVIEPGSIQTPFKANRRKAGIFLKGKSVYQKVLGNILFFGDHPSSFAPGPSRVAWEILRAVKEKPLSARTTVGLDAFWFPRVRWFLPDSIYDLVLRVMYSRFTRQRLAP